MLLLHLGQVAWIVGKMLSWSSLSITVISCLGVCFIVLNLISRFLDVCFGLCPHLLQVSSIVAWFFDLTFFGMRREPQFKQKFISWLPFV